MKITLLFVLLFCVALIGCQPPAANQTKSNSAPGTTKPTGPDPSTAKPFVVKESAFVVHASKLDDSVYLYWMAILQNPNADMFGDFPHLIITARDETGTVVGTEDMVFDEFTPGGTIAHSGQITVTKAPKTVDFAPSKTDWKAAAKPASAYPAITTSGVSMKPDQMAGGYIVVGEFANPYPVPLDEVAVTALFRDDAGKLIGGGTTYVDNAAASASRAFSVNNVSVEGKAAKVEVIVNSWSATKLRDLIK